MSRPRAWVLNLDAEDELASPATYSDPFAALAARPHLREALADLVHFDVVLGRGERATVGAIGRTFSPTPSALRALQAAGATCPPAPDVTVLRRVADRRFGLALGSGHVPGAFVLERGELAEVARAIPGPRVFKRVFGFAGRGRHLARGGGPTPAERAFVDRALRADGAVVVEPWLGRTVDLGIHGFVHSWDVAKSDLVTDGSDPVTRSGSPSGLSKSDLVTPPAAKFAAESDLVAADVAADTLVIGSPTIQLTTTAGGWRSSRLAEPDEVTSTEVAALEAQVHLTGAALLAAGYFGPFGIDAFRHVGPGGPGFVARCEINARYTMGWAIGMGSKRPDLVEP